MNLYVSASNAGDGLFVGVWHGVSMPGLSLCSMYRKKSGVYGCMLPCPAAVTQPLSPHCSVMFADVMLAWLHSAGSRTGKNKRAQVHDTQNKRTRKETTSCKALASTPAYHGKNITFPLPLHTASHKVCVCCLIAEESLRVTLRNATSAHDGMHMLMASAQAMAQGRQLIFFLFLSELKRHQCAFFFSGGLRSLTSIGPRRGHYG